MTTATAIGAIDPAEEQQRSDRRFARTAWTILVVWSASLVWLTVTICKIRYGI